MKTPRPELVRRAILALTVTFPKGVMEPKSLYYYLWPQGPAIGGRKQNRAMTGIMHYMLAEGYVGIRYEKKQRYFYATGKQIEEPVHT